MDNLYSNAIDLLIKYWRNPVSLEIKTRNSCRLLANEILKMVSASTGAQIVRDPENHTGDLAHILGQISSADPITRELIKSLAGTAPIRAATQTNNITGNGNQVITVNGDLIGNISFQSVLAPRQEPTSAPEPEYWLRLHITLDSQEHFTVQVLSNAITGEPRAQSELPYKSDEIQAISSAIEHRPSPEKISYHNREILIGLGLLDKNGLLPNLLEKIGQRLYAALFPGEIEQALTTLLNLARNQKKTLFLQLLFDKSAIELARYPWELLHDAYQPLLSGKAIDIIRDVAFQQARTNLKLKLPLKILYIAPRPQDLDPLPDFAERDALFESVQPSENVTVDQLPRPTYDALLEQLGQSDYHIFHFDGHGVFAKLCPACGQFNASGSAECVNLACQISLTAIQPKGFLAFETSDRQADLVDTDSVAQLFARSSLRLAFLSACQSSIVRGASLFGGLAPGLIRFDVPAAIGMQFSIPVSSAIKFVRGFYSTLLQTGRISASVARGRQYLYRDQQWHVPVAYIRNASADDILFNL